MSLRSPQILHIPSDGGDPSSCTATPPFDAFVIKELEEISVLTSQLTALMGQTDSNIRTLQQAHDNSSLHPPQNVATEIIMNSTTSVSTDENLPELHTKPGSDSQSTHNSTHKSSYLNPTISN